MELLGFKSLHIWHQAEHNPDVLDQFRKNAPTWREYLCQFDSLCDTPFYVLRKEFEQYFPDTTIVYTTRPKKDWVNSMLRSRIAGGDFLAKTYELPGIPY